jgi:hypothetical protein
MHLHYRYLSLLRIVTCACLAVGYHHTTTNFVMSDRLRFALLCASAYGTVAHGINVAMNRVACTNIPCNWVRQRTVDNTMHQSILLSSPVFLPNGFQSCFTVPYDLNIGRILVPIASNVSQGPLKCGRV